MSVRTEFESSQRELQAFEEELVFLIPFIVILCLLGRQEAFERLLDLTFAIVSGLESGQLGVAGDEKEKEGVAPSVLPAEGEGEEVLA